MLPAAGPVCYNDAMTQTLAHAPVQVQPAPIVGTWRRFGEIGPVYQVTGASAGGDWLMRIRVLESGEELDYPLAKILEDPREA